MKAALSRIPGTEAWQREHAEEIWSIVDDVDKITAAEPENRIFCEDNEELISLLESRHRVPPGLTKIEHHEGARYRNRKRENYDEVWVLPYFKAGASTTLDEIKELARTFGPVHVTGRTIGIPPMGGNRIEPVDELWVAYYEGDALVLEYNPKRASRTLVRRKNMTYVRKPLLSTTMLNIMNTMSRICWEGALSDLAQRPPRYATYRVSGAAGIINRLWDLAGELRVTTKIRRGIVSCIRDLRYHERNLKLRSEKHEYHMTSFYAWWTKENDRLLKKVKRRKELRSQPELKLKGKRKKVRAA